MNAELYGALPHPLTKPVPKPLDEWHLALTKAAIAHQLPFFGICRGLQLLNVAQGGTLHQHLPDRVGHTGHAPAPGVKGRHSVRIEPGSMLEPIMGLEPEVVTYHHQAIDKIGIGLKPIAWANDGTIEAAHLSDHPWALGVQWHPEEDESTLLKIFVSAVQKSPRRFR